MFYYNLNNILSICQNQKSLKIPKGHPETINGRIDDNTVAKKVSALLLFNGNSAIFQLYYGENKFILNDKVMISSL